MGSFAAGIQSVMSSLAQAKELQRRELIENIKIQMEQERLKGEQAQTETAKEYARLAGVRTGIEQQREKRLGALANQPTVSQWKVMGNTLLAMGQNPDGSPYVKSFPLNPEIGMQLSALQEELQQLPPEMQPIADSMIREKLAEGDFAGAAKAITPLMQAVAKSKIESPETIREGYSFQKVDVPEYGSVLVQTPTISGTRKVPAGTPLPSLPSSDISGAGIPVPAPLTSGTQDRPGVPQKAVPGVPQKPSPAIPARPNIQLPPGSRIVGYIPTPASSQKSIKLKPEMEAGLRVLHASLWGTSTAPGLNQYINVLDSKLSRGKMIAAGVGKSPNPYQWITTDLLKGIMYSGLSDDEAKFSFQLSRAISAINSLRSITGLPRSTQVLMDRYAQELPNPVTTSDSKRALYQLQLIEREINVAMGDAVNQLNKGDQGSSPIPAPGSSDVDKALDNLLKR